MAALPVDEEGHGVGRDLDEGAEEEGPGDVTAQVGGVLHVAVVAHEPHHADKSSDFNHIFLYYL